MQIYIAHTANTNPSIISNLIHPHKIKKPPSKRTN